MTPRDLPEADEREAARPTGFVVRAYVPGDADRVQRLVLGIQREEFGVPVTLEEQPDLRDVPAHYQKDHGAFWVAVDGAELVGTIGLLDIGHAQGALRKMFVAPSHRGAAVGVGAALLRTCLEWAASAGMREVLLGTTEQFRAAHRFYRKWGFTEIPVGTLPAHFPRMRLDTKFYRYVLALMLVAGAPARATAQDDVPYGRRSMPASESIALTRDGGTLRGTLLVPAAAGPIPVVLIHPGSGPTDRDGNAPILPGRNNSLRLLAEALAACGIASLRIDKRGVAASAAAAPAEADLRLETLVGDAVGWLDLLRQDRRFGPVVLLGHSEGALIAALAARQGKADGYVSIAGPARSGSAILRQQLRTRLTGAMAEANERILSALEQGEQADPVPPALFALYRPSVQPYLISWFRYVPAKEVAALTVPVLIAQGTTDLQVDTTEALALLRARPGANYLQVKGMNHVLKLVTGDLAAQRASYGDSTLAIAPALVAGVAAFIDRVSASTAAGAGAGRSADLPH